MKYLYYICSVLLLCWSCKSDQPSPQKAEVQVSATEPYHIINFSEGGLPLALRVPLGENPRISAQWNPVFGRMELSDEKGMSLFISEDTTSCATRKTEIENEIFKVKYLVDTEHLLFYKTALPDGSSPYWHFFASEKIGSGSYVFQNNPLVEFTEKEISYMTKIVRNIVADDNLAEGIHGKAK